MSPDEEESKIPNATPMSVKDRAKHLNKMASETDIHSSKAHKHERVCMALAFPISYQKRFIFIEARFSFLKCQDDFFLTSNYMYFRLKNAVKMTLVPYQVYPYRYVNTFSCIFAMMCV